MNEDSPFEDVLESLQDENTKLNPKTLFRLSNLGPAEMRQLLIDLRSETTNESAVEALERLAARFASSSGVEVSMCPSPCFLCSKKAPAW